MQRALGAIGGGRVHWWQQLFEGEEHGTPIHIHSSKYPPLENQNFHFDDSPQQISSLYEHQPG